MRFQELLRPAEQIPPLAGVKDRRRPGRCDQVSPPLIPLLRNLATVNVPVPLPGKAEMPLSGDDLAHLKGISLSLAVSLMLGVPFWAWIVGIARVVLR